MGRPFANVPAALDSIMMHLRPLVEERKENMLRFGKNYPGKPVRFNGFKCQSPVELTLIQQDLLTWFMEEVDGDSDEEKLKYIAFHFLTVNFGAVYTTTMVKSLNAYSPRKIELTS